MEQHIVFQNEGVFLKGTLTKPDTSHPCPVLIVLHTSHAGTRDFGVYQHLAHLLPAHGIAVLLYDRRGSGDSTGNFKTASFFDLANDAQAAIAALKSRSDIDPKHIGVWGMSQGGWIAPIIASTSPDIAFVVSVSSAGVTPAQQMNYSATYELQENGFSAETIRKMLELRGSVDQYYRGQVDRAKVQEKVDLSRNEEWFPFAYLDPSLTEDPTMEKWYQEMDFDPIPMLQKIGVPVLLLYGERDPWVPIAESIRIWKENASGKLSIHQIKDANHFMISIAHSGIHGDEGPLVEEYSEILTRWLQKQVA